MGDRDVIAGRVLFECCFVESMGDRGVVAGRVLFEFS